MGNSDGRGTLSKAAEVLYGSMTETQVFEEIRRTANDHGWRIYHTYNSRRSEAGFPDVVLVRGGQLLMWELKKASGRVTTQQQQWIDDLAACPGVDARAVWPSDLDDCLQQMVARPSSQ